MGTYRAPGVYVIEDQSTPMPLSGAPTGIPCFFGFTHRGPSLEPRRITSLNEYFAVFGSRPENRVVFPNAYMVDSLYAFFLNGGCECYVCRVNGGERATWPVAAVEDVVDFKRLEDASHSSSPDGDEPAPARFKVSAISGGTWANSLRIRAFKSQVLSPLPIVSVPITLTPPSSEAYEQVELRHLSPATSMLLPPVENLEGATLKLPRGEGAWTGKRFEFSAAQIELGSGTLTVKNLEPRPGDPEDIEIEVRYLPDTTLDPKRITDGNTGASITDEDMASWNVKTRVEFANVDGPDGRTSITANWDPETRLFYLLDGEGDPFLLTEDTVDTSDPLNGELHQPLRLKNESLGLSFDLQVLEPVPPRNPGDSTSYRLLEEYLGLSTEPNSPHYFLKKEGLVNGVSNRIELSEFEEEGRAVAFGVEEVDEATLVSSTAPGGAEVVNPGADAVPASTEYSRFFPLLKSVPDVSLISCPDAYLDGESTEASLYQPIYQAAIDFAHDNRCMVVIDSPPQAPARELGDLSERAKALETFADRFRSTHAAIYAPWFEAANLDPEPDEKTVHVPPSGFILGAYNRSDNNAGVWKAPANMPVLGVLGLQLDFTEEDSEVLNPAGVNLTRNFPGQGSLIWGARTTTKNVMWRYVNVRRLFLFVERSLEQQTNWAVFEPNDERTWNKLVNAADAFLRGLWRDGGLMGNAPEEAFQVQCGVPQTMTMEDVYNGLLKVEVKIAPVRPAEFVVFTVSQLVQKPSN